MVYYRLWYGVVWCGMVWCVWYGKHVFSQHTKAHRCFAKLRCYIPGIRLSWCVSIKVINDCTASDKPLDDRRVSQPRRLERHGTLLVGQGTGREPCQYLVSIASAGRLPTKGLSKRCAYHGTVAIHHSCGTVQKQTTHAPPAQSRAGPTPCGGPG